MHHLTAVGWALVLVAGGFLVADPVEDEPAVVDTQTTRNPHPPGNSHSFDWTVTAFECDTYFAREGRDRVPGLCLGYDGQRPAPVIVVNQDDHVNVTVHNDIAASIPEDHPEHEALAGARVSLHTHGVYVDASMDGISGHPGTNLIDSSIGPGESFTYSYQAPYVGAWHFHDHVLGVEGHEGSHRGLHGTLYVVEKGTLLDRLEVFDLHLLHTGPNGGAGLNETVQAGTRFDIAATALGDFVWTVTLQDPDGQVVDTVEMGPGSARGLTVRDARIGTYTWEASTDAPFFDNQQAFSGTIEVVA